MNFSLKVDEGLHQITSADELEKLIISADEAARSSPRLIELVAADGATLVVGVGGKKSYLNFVAADGWPAYSSVGESTTDELLPFEMDGYFTEIEGKFGITIHQAIEAAKEFLKNGQLPECLEWAEN